MGIELLLREGFGYELLMGHGLEVTFARGFGSQTLKNMFTKVRTSVCRAIVCESVLEQLF